MRLLLDECLPKRLRRELPGHEVRTVQDIEYQQSLAGLAIGLIVLCAASNDIDDLRPLLPGVVEALVALQPGHVIRVSA